MRLSIVQTALHWENAPANRAAFAEKLAPLAGHTDLVVLPEMFTTGFSMNAAALAEPMDGPTVQWMREQAERLGAAIAGSFICRENERFYNRLVFMRPGGQADVYDKRHLFTLAHEQDTYTPGRERLIVEWLGWRICPLVCYDLRFPVWSRNAGNPTPRGLGIQPSSSPKGEGGRRGDDAINSPLPFRGGAGLYPETSGGGVSYDLLLYVANWPSRRGHHWRALLPARAIENQCYVAGVNVTGADGNGYEYTGDSAVIDFSGQLLCQISRQEGVFTTKLLLEDMQQFRRELPFLSDADVFQLF